MSMPLTTLDAVTKVLGVALLAASLSLAAPSSASADSEFGHHVQTCARTMGFDGTHNPGMHAGRTGWDPTHAC